MWCHALSDSAPALYGSTDRPLLTNAQSLLLPLAGMTTPKPPLLMDWPMRISRPSPTVEPMEKIAVQPALAAVVACAHSSTV